MDYSHDPTTGSAQTQYRSSIYYIKKMLFLSKFREQLTMMLEHEIKAELQCLYATDNSDDFSCARDPLFELVQKAIVKEEEANLKKCAIV